MFISTKITPYNIIIFTYLIISFIKVWDGIVLHNLETMISIENKDLPYRIEGTCMLHSREINPFIIMEYLYIGWMVSRVLTFYLQVGRCLLNLGCALGPLVC